MTIGRRQLNATILADGTVLITGGTSACGFANEAGAVFAAERWNPSGGTDGQGAWTTMASMRVKRVYHSTAILLPDGRVLSAGGTAGTHGVVNNRNAEIYSPPYLFNGPRPTITSFPHESAPPSTPASSAATPPEAWPVVAADLNDC